MARDNSENLVYAASKALWKSEQRSRRREGALTRLFRFFRTVKKTKAELNAAGICQAEKRRKAYFDIYCDALAPIHEAFADINDCAWNFLLTFFRDLGNLVVDIANIFITAGYYLWSVVLFIYDYIQDFLFWCEGRKYILLRTAIIGTISVVGLAFFVNSITAYEYSIETGHVRVLHYRRGDHLLVECRDTCDEIRPLLHDELREGIGGE